MFDVDNRFLGDDLLYGTDVQPFNPDQSPQLEKLLNDDEFLDSGAEFYSPLHSNKSGHGRHERDRLGESARKKIEDSPTLKLQSSTEAPLGLESGPKGSSHSLEEPTN